MDQTWLMQAQLFLIFLHGPLCPTEWIYVEFQFTTTVFMLMAIRSSDLDDQKPGVNIQTEGHTLTPPSSKNSPEDPEALVAPHHIHHPSLQQGNQHLTGLRLSIVWKYMWHLPKMEEWHHPPHAWQAPVMEGMVQDGKSSLREAVVTGPGRAILFYGWWSLGEGLSLGEVWYAAFLLSGAISWVGKQAELSANPVSLGEGWQLITQAITKGCIKQRGPGHLHSIPPASTPFNFSNQDLSPWPGSLPTAAA